MYVSPKAHNIQLKDHIKFNRKEGQSVNATNPLRMRNKIIAGGRGLENLGRRGVREEKRRCRTRHGNGHERNLEDQENE